MDEREYSIFFAFDEDLFYVLNCAFCMAKYVNAANYAKRPRHSLNFYVLSALLKLAKYVNCHK